MALFLKWENIPVNVGEDAMIGGKCWRNEVFNYFNNTIL